MSCALYHRVSGVVFTLVALAHGWRAAQSAPLAVGTISIPVWVSWAGVVVSGGLAAWAFRSAR